MAKHEKTLEKLRRTPPAADLRWDDLKSLLKSLGYDLHNGSGSRRRFVNRVTKAIISLHEPHPSPNVDKGAVVDVAEHLKTHGLL